MRYRSRNSAFIALCIFSGSVFASCCDGVSKLDWENPKEALEYHACGCADSCWIAELKDKKTRKLKARLRCDCEKSYFQIGIGDIGGKAERLYENNCARFQTDSKFGAIHDAMQALRRSPRQPPQ